MSQFAHRLSSCYRKVRYSFYKSAQARWAVASKEYGGSFLQIYWCRYCAGWHLGNSISVKDAKKRLEKLEKQMDHRHFWTKASAEVQSKLHRKRLELIRYLISKIEAL